MYTSPHILDVSNLLKHEVSFISMDYQPRRCCNAQAIFFHKISSLGRVSLFLVVIFLLENVYYTIMFVVLIVCLMMSSYKLRTWMLERCFKVQANLHSRTLFRFHVSLDFKGGKVELTF